MGTLFATNLTKPVRLQVDIEETLPYIEHPHGYAIYSSYYPKFSDSVK
jgi:hypothetical protein